MMQKGATLSACGAYRFRLHRIWDDRPRLLVVMFNPSTADHEYDDPTITLLCHIASHNNFGGIVVVNLCPLRCSTPAKAIAMLQGAQCHAGADFDARRVLWENVAHIESEAQKATAVLIAWGSMGGQAGDWYGVTMQTIQEVMPRLPIFHLGRCANGHPKHPLARGKHKVPKNAPLLPWKEAK